MVTKEQAISADEFHYGDCTKKMERWRRNGSTQTWKRSPERFRVPVKHGMYNYGQLTDDIASGFHVASECPLLSEDKGE